MRAANKRKACISPNDGTESSSPNPNSSNLETPHSRESCPTGNKASKRRQVEEKLLENVSSKLKEGLSNNNSSGAGVYNNANPQLKKRYDELLLKEKIYQLEEVQRRREMEQQKNNKTQQQRLDVTRWHEMNKMQEANETQRQEENANEYLEDASVIPETQV